MYNILKIRSNIKVNIILQLDNICSTSFNRIISIFITGNFFIIKKLLQEDYPARIKKLINIYNNII